jgi:hypothetical protein
MAEATGICRQFLIAGFYPKTCTLQLRKRKGESSHYVEEKRSPGKEFYGWSSGHIVCIVIGVIVWALLFIGLGSEA